MPHRRAQTSAGLRLIALAFALTARSASPPLQALEAEDCPSRLDFGTAAPVAQLVGAWVNGAASAKVTDSRKAGVCRLDCTETSSTSEPTEGPCATARVSCLTEKPGFTWNLKNCRKARFSPSARPVQEQSES